MDKLELSFAPLCEDQPDVVQVLVRINDIPLEDWVARAEFDERCPDAGELERARASRFAFPEGYPKPYRGITPFELRKQMLPYSSYRNYFELMETPPTEIRLWDQSIRVGCRKDGNVVEWGNIARYGRKLGGENDEPPQSLSPTDLPLPKDTPLRGVGPFRFDAKAYQQEYLKLEAYRIPIRRTPPTPNLLPPREEGAWDTIRFVFEHQKAPFSEGLIPVAHIFLNGYKLQEWIDRCEYVLDGDISPEECERVRAEGLPPTHRSSYGSLECVDLYDNLGCLIPHSKPWESFVQRNGHRPDDTTHVLCCDGCRVIGCWPMEIRSRITQDAVEWFDFKQPHRNDEEDFWRYEHMGTFRFERSAYMEEFARLEAFALFLQERSRLDRESSSHM